MRVGLKLCFALVSIVCISLAMWMSYTEASYAQQGRMVGIFAVALIVSPVVFAVMPRRMLASPQLVLLIWWVIPLSSAVMGLHYMVDEGSLYPRRGLFLAVAGFWAMFTPVAVVGARFGSRS